MEHADHNETTLSIVLSFHNHRSPPRRPAAELPAAASDSPCAACGQVMEESLCCDACDRGFHVSCAGRVGDEDWVCKECVNGGVASRRWRLGFVPHRTGKKRCLRDEDDRDGHGVSRKHTPADNSFAGKELELQKEAGDVAKADKLSFEDIPCDKDLEMKHIDRLKQYISERNGVLPEGWHLTIRFSSTSHKSQVVYYSPTGEPFHSMRGVASHLKLISNDVEDPQEETGSFYDQLTDILPIEYEDFFVLSLGKVDSRLSYHNTDKIWPVGYKSCWHDKITGSNFVCEVLDGGNSGPVFQVSRFSCSTVPVPSLCTLFVSLNHGRNIEKQDVVEGLNEEEYISFKMLLEDPPTENDSRCCLINSSDISAFKDEVGEFCVQGSSPYAAWRMVSEKLVDSCREMYEQRCTLNFRCEHLGEGMDEDTCSYLAKLSGSSSSFKIPSAIGSEVEIETVLEGLRRWSDQDRFGLEVEFVQKIIEFLPGARACSKYNSLKSRRDSSVGNSHLEVITKDGMQMKGKKAIRNLVKRSRKVKAKINRDPVMTCPKLPEGKPVCTMLPSQIVGDAMQVMEFFQRFYEVLEVEGLLLASKLEMELASPYFDKNQIGEFGLSSSGSALSRAHTSLLKVLHGELLTKVSAVVDPGSDLKDSKLNRGRKRNADSSVICCGKLPNILPVNELTWPELARRYLLAVMCDCEADSTECGKVYRCLIGDGGELCGSLTGVLGMEADALLLAQAMKKIFGSLDRECDMLTVDDGGAAQPSASESILQIESGGIPEWALPLEPVRKLPTNVGARIRKCVHAALEKSPPEWAKKILENSISKEVYKGNASGPTKKAVLSVLNTVCPEGEGRKAVREKKMADETRKVKNYVSISDIIMRQCRIIWRQVANADSNKTLCNLLGRRRARSSDSEHKGILGFSASVSRSLDFRTIDLKLAVGAYDGLHEAFLDDVREFWNHVRVSWREKSDLLRLVDNLASKFNELYGKEVLGLHQKLQGYARLGCLSADSKKDVDELITSASVLPRAPWEAGICKICGVDREDSLVLLCDTCDAEYHTYCLNPPLARVPPGNWHCPCCVSKQNDGKGSSECISANSGSSRPNHGEFTGLRFDELTKLASLLEEKDYWEYRLNERTSLLKLLCDELLNSTLIHRHLEHCSETSAELQQKLRAAYTDLKNVNKREEKSAAKIGEIGEGSEVLEANNLGDSRHYGDELKLVDKEITNIWDSIINTEVELMKVSGRRDFLGADSAGRLYWVWAKPGQKLCVIENGVERSLPQGSEVIPNTGASTWVIYESLQELKQLVDFLRDSDERERELKETIQHRLRIRFQDPGNETLNECHETQGAVFYKDSPGSESLFTKASGLLEGIYGSWFDLKTILAKKGKYVTVISDDKLFRCNCLEPILPSKYHCVHCHKTSPTKKELDGHNEYLCKLGVTTSSQSQRDTSAESGNFYLFLSKLKTQEDDGLKSPFNFEEICSKFVTMDSLKDLVGRIGFLGSSGVPLFLSSESPNLRDPTLTLNIPAKDVMVEKKTDAVADNSSRSNKNQNSLTPSLKSQTPLLDNAYYVLVQLKVNLLDMEATLPRAALRASKACIKRRWAWRAFLKSAKTIDEMVQAMMVFEDMIKSEYLKNSWWYWSSLSAAAKISTLSALGLRIYSLDAAIIYDKSASSNKSDAAESSVLAKKAKKRRTE